MQYPNAKLIVFSKAPTPGQVKTRLTPTLSENDAARLHSHMLEQTIKMAIESKLTSVELHCAPNTDHVFFAYLRKKYSIPLQPQIGTGLGERMFNALSNALNIHSSAVLIGTDCPEMQINYLQQAFDHLETERNDIVIGPVEDGGYVLIGATRIDKQVFEDIDWSTERVFTQSIEKINKLDWKYHKLDPIWDLDTAEDLQRLPENLLKQILEKKHE
jgi:uncharacterized protein